MRALKVLEKHRVDGLIVIGGDGSLKGARALNRFGLPVIGLPGTIDNDLFGTDMGISVDTAETNRFERFTLSQASGFAGGD